MKSLKYRLKKHEVTITVSKTFFPQNRRLHQESPQLCRLITLSYL